MSLNFSSCLRRLALPAFLLLGTTLFAQQPLEATLRYVQQNLKTFGLTEEDLSDFVVRDEVLSKHNGVTHLYLVQRHEGIEVHNAMLNANVLPSGRVLSVGNKFIPDLHRRVNATRPAIGAEQAVQAVFEHFNLPLDAPLQLKERPDEHHAVFRHEGIALEPIPVRLVYQPMPDKSVRLAWNVEVYTPDARHWWNARVDALTGQVLDYFDQVIHCEFGTNIEEICEEETPLGGIGPAFSPPVLLNNAYNVFPLTVESPNHGDRSLEVNPADPEASPFGWHDTDGQPGAEFTITRGNNVHAYHDIFAQNSPLGDEPDGGDSLVFDFPIDLPSGKPYTFIDAAVTNLFYWCNLMHDVWYHYGFDEAAGNFQANNYGNGGAAGDFIRAEAMDGSGTNNANYGGGPDGSSARIQMFLWGSGIVLPNGSQTLVVTAPGSVAGDYQMAPGAFGGELPDPANPIVSEVVLVNDSTGTPTDACEPILNGDEIQGKIAMIDRGSCQFGTKSLQAQNLGAIAVIICNNVADPPLVTMAPGDDGDQVTIPVVMVSLQDCNTIKTGLPGLTVKLSKGDFVIPDPGPTAVAGDFDNGVIAHEYTHGISIRLTGGPGTSSCLTNQEQAGEGWSDWFGLVMTTTSNMTAEQRRGIGTYVTGQGTTGVGIRTYPYSRDMNVDPHTYADINSEAIPHGVGSVWAVMIWDLYWNLVDAYGFDPDFYHGTGGNNMAMQLVLDGLKMQPCNPTFVEARDAILAADEANYGGANKCLIWETFARRGLGFSATAGGGEAFDIPPECDLSLKINKTAAEAAEAGSVVTYTLEIINSTQQELENVIVTDPLPPHTSLVPGSSSCGGDVSGGVLSIPIGTLGIDEVLTCTYQLQLDDEPFSYVAYEDPIENGSGINWDRSHGLGEADWSLSPADPYSGTLSFFAEDTEGQCDQYLALAEPLLIEGTAPVLSFWHRYNTEKNWDGGVVEISVNGGDWEDLGSLMTQNGYDGPINTNPDSPISGRPAFHGNSGGYIQTLIDLSSFLGQTVNIRFRMGCDAFVGGEGWFVDQVQFFGNFHSITNQACVDSDSEDPVCASATTLVFGDPVSAVEELPGVESLTLFPNPTNDRLFVRLQSSEPLPASTLRLRSVTGQLLLENELPQTGSATLDLHTLPAGLYFLEIQTGPHTLTRKVVRQ